MLQVEVTIALKDELGNSVSELKIPVSMQLFEDPESFGIYIANAVQRVRGEEKLLPTRPVGFRP